jgi:hypothetical protein
MVSVAEVAWHRTREPGYTGSFDDSAGYVGLLADFIVVFDDITDNPADVACTPIRRSVIRKGRTWRARCAAMDRVA